MKTYNAIDLRRIIEETMEGQIINSLLDNDFYKSPMGEYIYCDGELREAEVIWQFKNRTTSVRLGDIIEEKKFMEQYEAYRKLKMTNSEFHYLRGTFEYDQRMFSEPYLEHLKTFKPSEAIFNKTNDGQLDIRWGKGDTYKNSSDPELPVIKIVNGLYIRSILGKMTPMDREAVFAEGIKRLSENIKKLKAHPIVTFSDFANRRCFSGPWLEYVTVRLAEELGPQFKGTSKTSLAMKHGWVPMGTVAHELQMVHNALRFNGTRESLVRSIIEFHYGWWKKFGRGLSICLPDTLGTDFTLSILPVELMRQWRGWRLDSKKMMVATEQIYNYIKNVLQVDPHNKLAIPSDGLSVDDMIEISEKFGRLMNVSHGWGTKEANDLGIPTISIIGKPLTVNGKGAVKVSDNLAKSIGPMKDQEDYKNVIGYKVEYNEMPTV